MASKLSLLCMALLFAGVSTGPLSLSERRAYIEQLSPDEKQQLLTQLERFRELPEAEQQRLRALSAALEAAPDAAELRQTLDAYQEFLGQLPGLKRSELLQLEPAARLKQIKQWLAQPHDSSPRQWNAPRLSDGDREAVAAWVEQQALSLVPNDKRAEFENLTREERRRMLGRMMQQRMSSNDPNQRLGPPWQRDLQSLRDKLSPEARERLDQAEASPNRSGVWMNWLGQSLGMLPNPEQFKQFYSRDLPADERQRLLSLPADEMQREMRRMYMERGEKPTPPIRRDGLMPKGMPRSTPPPQDGRPPRMGDDRPPKPTAPPR